jgi:hypothetical protein
LGYDVITGQILKELPIVGIKYLTQLCNAVLLKGYFPEQWKLVQVILILKPGKPPHELSNKILIYKAIFKPIWTYGIQQLPL